MKIYLASGNAHKVQEFQAIADRARAEGGVSVEFVSAKKVGGMPEVVEDTGTFVGNARKKAAALRAKLEASPVSKDALWVLADDSGICVDALGGGPGVESAYFAGPAGDPAANLRKLVEVMRGEAEGKTESRRAAGAPCDGTEPTGTSALPGKAFPGRGAHFVCVLVLLGPDGLEQVVEERVYGTLLVEPRGGDGFGYDPLFVPEGFARSYAELSEAEKNAISHRARAAGRLMAWVARKC